MACEQDFTEIFDQVYPGLCRFLEAYMGKTGSAQEIAQGSFLRLFRVGLDVEAVLLEDGKAIAAAKHEVLIEEARDLILRLPAKGGAEAISLDIKLTVDGYTRSRPVDSVSLKFDIDRVSGISANRIRLASNWHGICELGRSMSYDLTEPLHGEPGKFEFRVTVRLGMGESPD